MLTPLFTPVQRKRTFEEVSSAIKDLIVNGSFRPGDRLPGETELARQFKVGRQTIREALRILELSGLITVQKGGTGGPIVRNAILDAVNTLLLDAFQLEDLTVEEISQARLEIEKVVLSQAILLCSDADLRALEENIRCAKEKVAQDRTAFDDNLAFHVLLAQAAHNRILVVVVRAVMTMLGNLLLRLNPTAAISKVAVEAHEQIVAALRGRNKNKAMRALESHLHEVSERLQSLPRGSVK